MRSKAAYLLLGLIVLAQSAFAGNGVPNLLPFQGRVTDVNGIPINYSVTINIRIYPPTGTCYIYEDTQVVTPNAYGLFSIILGSPGNSTGPTNTFASVFNNDVAAPVDTDCTGSPYSPNAGDWRRLLIVVDGVPLPDMQTIAASAYSMNSALLEGRSANDFIQVLGNVTQSTLDLMTSGSDASVLHNHDSLYTKIDGSTPFTGSVTTNGGIYAPSAGATIGIGTTSTHADLEIAKLAPSLRLQADGGGGGTSQIDFYGGASQRGSIRTTEGVDGMSFYSGSALSLYLDQNNAAHFYGPVSTLGTLGLAQFTDAQETTLLTNMNAADTGKIWYNTTSGTIKAWNGTAAIAQLELDGTGKIDSAWIPNTSVAAGSYGNATNVPTFTVGVDGRLTAAGTVTISGTLPGGAAGGDLTGTYPDPTIANNAVNNAKLANDSITSAKILSTGIAANRLLMTDASGGTTLKYSQCWPGEVLMWTATGWMCTDAATLLGPSGATAGTYGTGTDVATVSVDANGRVTAASNTAIAFPVTSVNGKTGAVALVPSDIPGFGTAATLNVGTGSNEILQLDGSGKIPQSLLPSTAGTITEVDAGVGLTGGGPAGVVTLNVDVGTTANKILQLNSAAEIPAVDGWRLTNVNAVKLQSRAVASATPNNGEVLMWNGSSAQWEPTLAPVTTVAGRTGNVVLNYNDVQNGSGVYLSYKPDNTACTDGQILSWNNTVSHWECGNDNNAGGTITEIATGNGLLGGPITLTGTISVDTGVTTGKIIQVAAGDKLPAIDGSSLTNLNATRIGTRTVSTASPSTGQFLGYNATAGQWEPTVTVINVTPGTGLVAGPITTTGTINVDVGTTAGKIVQVTGGDQYPAIDGNLITNVNAVKLQTYNVAANTPTSGQVLTWNNSAAQWEPQNTNYSGAVVSVTGGTGLNGGTITSSGTFDVDVGTTAGKILQVTGGNQYPAVDGSLITNVNAANIRGKFVSLTAPTDAQALLYNGTTGTWVPASITGDVSVTNTGAANVAAIQGKSVKSGTPGAGQVLTWNNSASQWEPQNTNYSGAVVSITTSTGLTGGVITSSGTIAVDVGTTGGKIVQITGGDQYPAVDGNLITNVNAANIRGKFVSLTAPTDAQLLFYNGTTSMWAPASFTGDVSVTNTGASNVTAIQGKSVKTGTPGTGQVLTWNGTTTQWEFQTPTVGTLTSITAGAGLLGGTIGVTGTISVDTGVVAGKIVEVAAGDKLPVIDGSNLTNITPANMGGVLPIAKGGTNSAATLNNNRLMVSNGGAIVEAAAMTDGQIVVGKTANAPQIVNPGGDVSSISNTGSFTVAKVNGVAYPASPATGTLPSVTGANTVTYSATPTLGVNGTTAGAISFANNAAGGASTTIAPNSATLTAWTLTLPENGGTNGYVLQTNGSGGTSWVQPSALTGSVSSGTANQIAYYGSTGSAVSGNANATISGGALTLGKSGTIGNLILAGNTSGAVTVAPQAAAGTYNFNLPTAAGTSGQVLTSGGGAAAPMTWTTLAASATIDTTNAANISTGTLSPARMPALTGDTTMSAGTTSTTTVKVNGVAYPASPATGTLPSVTGANTVTYSATPTLGVNAATTGKVSLANGGASGASTTIQPSSSTTAAWTFTLPPNGGSNNYVLQTDGSGLTSWVAPASLVGSVSSGTANQLAWFSSTGTSVAGNANATMSSGALTLGVSGSALGSLNLSGSTSGTVSIKPQAAAGTYNFNLPSAAGTSGDFLTSAGGGASAMTWTSTVNVAHGGTGLTSGTQGGVPYFSASTTMASSSAGTTGQVLISGGTGAPTWTSTPAVTTLSAGGSISASGGSITAQDGVVASGGAVNFGTGNVQVLQSVGGTTITTSGMTSGGAYTVIVTDTASRTYTFAGQCATSNYIPANAPTQSGKKSVYTILYSTNMGASTCLISWVSGF